MSEGLVEFLLARYAEEEAEARRAKPGPWTYDGDIYATHPTDRVVDWVYDESAEHIARWDPARVLADVEAKRWIVAEHSGGEEFTGAYCPSEQGRYLRDRCPTLRALALPYASHPAYNPAWRP